MIYNNMTKKDYVHIAEVLRRAKYQAENPLDNRALSTIESIASDMCEMLKYDNPRFDYKKFYNEIEYK